LNQKIVLVDPKKPEQDKWETLVEEKPENISSITTAGGKMFITKDKLTELQNLSEIELYKKTLQTQYEVTAAYYDIVKQKQQLASLQEVLSYNEERVRITEAGFAAGTLARPDLLQAEIDRNVTLENIVAQQFIIGTAKKYLLLLLGSCDFTDFDVVESISSDYFPDNTKLAAQLDTANTGNLSFRSQMEIARLSIEENKRAMFPEIRLTAGYYLSQYNNSDGNVLRNYSLGPLAGASLKIPIFNGGTVRRQKAISELEFETACYQLESYKKQVNTELQNALSNFENQKQLIEIEKENNILAKENIEISIQRLAQGETTSLEVHLAQESFMQSCTRLINFLYNLKLAETQLKQLVSEM